LLAGDSVERKSRAHFSDTRGAFGDHHEIYGDENGKDYKTDDKVATHHELREPANDIASGHQTLGAVGKNQSRRRDIERQAQQGGDKENGWKGGKVQWPLDPKCDHKNEHRQSDRERKADIN
jgi:hypothetical protein